MSRLPIIPDWDYRQGGLARLAADRPQAAVEVMEAVLSGLGAGGRAVRALLPLGDRIAARHLARIGDPYRDEILALPDLMGRPGAIAFSLSYEWGCTSRAFAGDGPPVLLRVLDWPFHGIGRLFEVVRLSGPAGDWITATWPGVLGVLHGTAPERFAIALNQAPERRSALGRIPAWVASKRRFLRQPGLPPAHLLRRVFETAPDFASAKAMLTEAPVAAPVIFTLAGTRPDEACTIERTEDAANLTEAVAANHFATSLGHGGWRPRGIDSTGRRATALALAEAPPVDALPRPILNDLTRLALVMDATGRLEVAGYEGTERVTQAGQFRV